LWETTNRTSRRCSGSNSGAICMGNAQSGLARRLSDADDAVLLRLVRQVGSVDPRVSQGVAFAHRPSIKEFAPYCAANWPPLHAGDRDAARVARHCTIRPPPGATAPHNARTSPPHADFSTNNSSRGRIGRNTSTAGAPVGAAAGVTVAAGALRESGLAAPPTARTACCRRPRPLMGSVERTE
jgi:hypothetical protein